MSTQHPLKTQRGLGLLEVLLALVVAGAILLLGARYFRDVSEQQRISQAAGMVTGIHQAALTYVQAKNTDALDGMEDLLESDMIPPHYDRDPWGGAVEAATNSSLTQITISMLAIPDNSCVQLQSRLSQTVDSSRGESVSCSGGKLTVKYVLY